MEETKGKNETDIAEKLQHDHSDSSTENLKSLLLPLMEKVDQLRESMVNPTERNVRSTP